MFLKIYFPSAICAYYDVQWNIKYRWYLNYETHSGTIQNIIESAYNVAIMMKPIPSITTKSSENHSITFFQLKGFRLYYKTVNNIISVSIHCYNGTSTPILIVRSARTGGAGGQCSPNPKGGGQTCYLPSPTKNVCGLPLPTSKSGNFFGSSAKKNIPQFSQAFWPQSNNNNSINRNLCPICRFTFELHH